MKRTGIETPYPCPACGRMSFLEPPGSMDRCKVCGWTDDQIQLCYPTFEYGMNDLSLFDYQKILLETSSYNPTIFAMAEGWRPIDKEIDREYLLRDISADDPRLHRLLERGDHRYYWAKGFLD